MSDHEHMLERRARLLANRITQQVELIRNAIAPPGARPPFTKQLSEPQALAWWQKNRHNEYGRRVLDRMSETDILELDTALARFGNEEGVRNGSREISQQGFS